MGTFSGQPMSMFAALGRHWRQLPDFCRASRSTAFFCQGYAGPGVPQPRQVWGSLASRLWNCGRMSLCHWWFILSHSPYIFSRHCWIIWQVFHLFFPVLTILTWFIPWVPSCLSIYLLTYFFIGLYSLCLVLDFILIISFRCTMCFAHSHPIQRNMQCLLFGAWCIAPSRLVSSHMWFPADNRISFFFMDAEIA